MKRKAANSMQTLKTVLSMTLLAVLVLYLSLSYYFGEHLGPDSESTSWSAKKPAGGKKRKKVDEAEEDDDEVDVAD